MPNHLCWQIYKNALLQAAQHCWVKLPGDIGGAQHKYLLEHERTRRIGHEIFRRTKNSNDNSTHTHSHTSTCTLTHQIVALCKTIHLDQQLRLHATASLVLACASFTSAALNRKKKKKAD